MQSQPHQQMDGAQATMWQAAADSVADLALEPIECKAVYIVGLARHLIESAGLCLEEERHLAAFLLAIDSVELLGQVATRQFGGRRSPEEVLADGLLLVAKVDNGERSTVVVETASGVYTVDDCIARRRFSAHGGASAPRGSQPVLDAELARRLMGLVLEALDRLWAKWQAGRQRLLAFAEITPLFAGGHEVVFVRHLHATLADGGSPGGAVQHQGWRKSQ